MRSKDSAERIKLAGRVLIRTRCGGGHPILPAEIAQLRFFAESDQEVQMPLDQLAQTVIERERKRMGISFPKPGILPTGRN